LAHITYKPSGAEKIGERVGHGRPAPRIRVKPFGRAAFITLDACISFR
jgi:hypothetical protein